MSDICSICGALMEPVSCWQCLGEGGWHECGEDTCCCLDPDDITDICEECDGEGEYLCCPAVEHTEEQLAAYRARMAWEEQP